jgi:hypothetical protein
MRGAFGLELAISLSVAVSSHERANAFVSRAASGVAMENESLGQRSVFDDYAAHSFRCSRRRGYENGWSATRQVTRLHTAVPQNDKLDPDGFKGDENQDQYAMRLSSSISDLFATSSRRKVSMEMTAINPEAGIEDDSDGLIKARELQILSAPQTLTNIRSVKSENVKREVSSSRRERIVPESNDKVSQLINQAMMSRGSYEEAPLLPPDAYDDDESLNFDGSIRGKTGPSLPPLSVISRSPNSCEVKQPHITSDKDAADSYGSLDPEELHMMIMRQEQGYKDQSPEFKEALFGGMQNRTHADRATEKRRENMLWKKKELEALDSLRKNMEGFEDVLDENQKSRQEENRTKARDQPTTPPTTSCGRYNNLPTRRNTMSSSNSEMSASARFQSRSRPLSISRPSSGDWNRNTNPKPLTGGDPNLSVVEEAKSRLNSEAPLQYYKREMHRYKEQAQKAEAEVRRLRQMVKVLETRTDASPPSNNLPRQERGAVAKKPKSWVLMNDPESNEAFYMNPDTGEMRFESEG